MSSERSRAGKRPRATRWPAVVGVLGAGLLLSASARADSLACNSRIVSTGDSRYEVKAVCGDPDDKVERIEYRTLSGRVARDCKHDGSKVVCSSTRGIVVEVVVEEWVYDFGRNRFIEYLTFEQGHLMTVRSGSYGQKPPK